MPSSSSLPPRQAASASASDWPGLTCERLDDAFVLSSGVLDALHLLRTHFDSGLDRPNTGATPAT